MGELFLKSQKAGFIIGRFQPFHVGHLNYLREALLRFDELFVGITNPDPQSHKKEPEDNHRHKREANIFFFYERVLMIKETLLDLNLDLAKIQIVPFPIHQSELWKYYIPFHATGFIRIFDDWDDKKIKMFNSAGYSVEFRRLNESQRDASGSLIRRLLKENGNWQDFVPSGTKKVIENCFMQSDRYREFITDEFDKVD